MPDLTSPRHISTLPKVITDETSFAFAMQAGLCTLQRMLGALMEMAC